MGCASDLRCRDNTPVRDVNIEPFAMSIHEVTRGEFRRFVKQTGYVTDAEHPDALDARTDAMNAILRRNKSDHGCSGLLAGAREGQRQAFGYTWKDIGIPQTDQHPVVCVSRLADEPVNIGNLILTFTKFVPGTNSTCSGTDG